MRVTYRTAEFVNRPGRDFWRRLRIGFVVAGVVSLAACSQSDQREAERKAAEAAKQAGEAVEKAKDKAGETARDVAAQVGPAARDAALKGASAAAAIGSQAVVAAGRATEAASVRAAGALRTGAIRAALLRESSLDVTDVNVDTDEPAKRVVLKGRVKSTTQRSAIERITQDKAPGYTIENRLVVKG
jgi:hypothetical protein